MAGPSRLRGGFGRFPSTSVAERLISGKVRRARTQPLDEWEKDLVEIVMAERVPATRPRSVGPPRRLYNRRCVGGRDTPGHDGERTAMTESRPCRKEGIRLRRARRAFGTWMVAPRAAVTDQGRR